MRSIAVFVAVAMALAIVFSAAVALTGGPQGTLGRLAFATMLIPALTAWLLDGAMGEGPRIDWSRFPVRDVPLALLLMPGVMHAALLPAMYRVAGGLPWSGHPAWPRIAVNAIAGVLGVSLFALFEEIGWRGWLLPRLSERLGRRRAIVATSIVWALWHVPFVLAGILSVSGFSVWRTLAIVPLGTAGAGLIIGWLWMRTRSIWIAALAHGALNNWGQLAFRYMTAGPGVDLAPVLLAGSIALVVTGCVLLTTVPAER